MLGRTSKSQRNLIDLEMLDGKFERHTVLGVTNKSEAVRQSQSTEFVERIRQARELAKDLARTEPLPSNATRAIAALLNAPEIIVLVRRTCASSTTATGVESGLG
jgi:hypothetical protein